MRSILGTFIATLVLSSMLPASSVSAQGLQVPPPDSADRTCALLFGAAVSFRNGADPLIGNAAQGYIPFRQAPGQEGHEVLLLTAPFAPEVTLESQVPQIVHFAGGAAKITVTGPFGLDPVPIDIYGSFPGLAEIKVSGTTTNLLCAPFFHTFDFPVVVLTYTWELPNDSLSPVATGDPNQRLDGPERLNPAVANQVKPFDSSFFPDKKRFAIRGNPFALTNDLPMISGIAVLNETLLTGLLANSFNNPLTDKSELELQIFPTLTPVGANWLSPMARYPFALEVAAGQKGKHFRIDKDVHFGSLAKDIIWELNVGYEVGIADRIEVRCVGNGIAMGSAVITLRMRGALFDDRSPFP